MLPPPESAGAISWDRAVLLLVCHFHAYWFKFCVMAKARECNADGGEVSTSQSEESESEAEHLVRIIFADGAMTFKGLYGLTTLQDIRDRVIKYKPHVLINDIRVKRYDNKRVPAGTLVNDSETLIEQGIRPGQHLFVYCFPLNS